MNEELPAPVHRQSRGGSWGLNMGYLLGVFYDASHYCSACLVVRFMRRMP